MVECTAFVSWNFICFLGVNEQVDDRGHRVVLRVVIPLRTVERILPRVCVVSGIYQAGEKVDALLLNTSTARHQIVWVDEIEEAVPHLQKAWEGARSSDRASDALPVSLILNPEFASLSASSTEVSPRARLTLRPLTTPVLGQDQEQDDAVSDEYDSDHAESFRSMERNASVSSPKVDFKLSGDGGGGGRDVGEEQDAKAEEEGRDRANSSGGGLSGRGVGAGGSSAKNQSGGGAAWSDVKI